MTLETRRADDVGKAGSAGAAPGRMSVPSIIAANSMTPGRIGCALAVVAVICVLAVFFFPAMEGPYSVVHGPVTALLSARAAAGVRMAIVRAGLNPVRSGRNCAQATPMELFWIQTSLADFESVTSPVDSSLILRC